MLVLSIFYIISTKHRLLPERCSDGTKFPEGQVSWVPEETGEYEVQINTCRVERFTHRKATRCLARKHLLFIGDSVSRYQYLSLVHFLETGLWKHPKHDVSYQGLWGKWHDFYARTSALFRGNERCDCYRSDRLSNSIQNISDLVENRFYEYKDIKVSYIQLFNDALPPHGHFGFPPFLKSKVTCRPGECAQPPDWAYPLACTHKPCTALFSAVVQPLAPTWLFLNQGLWIPPTKRTDKWFQDLFSTGRKALPGTMLFWKTTTRTNSTKQVDDSRAVKWAVASGWRIFDVGTLTAPATKLEKFPGWDPKHFHAFVYRELNIFLLNLIC